MRSCEEIQLMINLSLDDMLPSQDRQALVEHLESCPACRACHETLRAMKDGLRQMEEPVPHGLHDRIMDYVQQNGGDTGKQGRAIPFRARRWTRLLAGAAACAVIAVAALRFAPSHDLALPEMASGNTAMDTAVTSAPAAAMYQESQMAESAEGGYMPGNEPVTAPPQEAAKTDAAVADEEELAVFDTQNTGQMAEDLPPLRKENMGEDNEYQVAAVQKWLKVTGKREALPDWVDRHFVYQAELDGTSREYVEIAAWAEEYWIDQLTACGFLIEELEEEVVEDGEHILLIFFWEE